MFCAEAVGNRSGRNEKDFSGLRIERPIRSLYYGSPRLAFSITHQASSLCSRDKFTVHGNFSGTIAMLVLFVVAVDEGSGSDALREAGQH